MVTFYLGLRMALNLAARPKREGAVKTIFIVYGTGRRARVSSFSVVIKSN